MVHQWPPPVGGWNLLSWLFSTTIHRVGTKDETLRGTKDEIFSCTKDETLQYIYNDMVLQWQ